MKKILFCLLSLSCFFICSCASNKVAVKENWGPVAIMSMTFNENIEWEGEDSESGGLLKLAANKIVDNLGGEDSALLLGKTNNLFEDAKSAVSDVFENELGLEVVNENTVLSLPEYVNGKTDKAMAIAFVSPEGYLPYSSKNKVAKEIKSVIGANSFAYISFNVGKHMYNGVGKTGSVTGGVSAIVTICDEKGKVLANYTGYSSCFDRIPCVKGIYDKKALQEMYPEVFKYALMDAFFN